MSELASTVAAGKSADERQEARLQQRAAALTRLASRFETTFQVLASGPDASCNYRNFEIYVHNKPTGRGNRIGPPQMTYREVTGRLAAMEQTLEAIQGF